MSSKQDHAHTHAHDNHPAISRRNLLILGGVAIVAGALPATFLTLEPDNSHFANDLMSLLAEPEAAARLGTEWRKVATMAREPAVIAASIGKRLNPHGWNDLGTPEELREALKAAIVRDYAHNDMVSIGGWQIARTSAELCALAASLNGESADDETDPAAQAERG